MARLKGRFATGSLAQKYYNVIKLNKIKRVGQDDYNKVPGRRIVDIKFFGEQFDKGCGDCKTPFTFKNIRVEYIKGLCSVLVFRCSDCATDTRISTSRMAKEPYRSTYTVNMKAALGMIHAGVGEVHINSFLTTLGIPPIHHKTLKRIERKVGTVLEETAHASCINACKDERNVLVTDTLQADEEHLSFEEAMDYVEDESLSYRSEVKGERYADLIVDTPTEGRDFETPLKEVEIVVSQDAAWTKRGRGMNSLSGWGHVIGERTKKCLNFSTRVKNCAKCKFYERTGQIVRQHDCRKNWSGSAKSMEPDIAADLHQQARHVGLKFSGVIGDEDSSSIKHIREKVNKDIRKFSDFGHLKRTLRGKLEKLQKQHKSMTLKVRESFIKNFAYAVKQNKAATEEKMSQSLSSIVPHMYGEHGKCGHWCTNASGKPKPHSNLPRGMDLTDLDLRIVLENALASFISNPGKLMTSGSTQPNESLNSIAWSKAPKIRNYNASESFDYRCAAAVLQYNDGTSYINKVVESCELTPQKVTASYIAKKDKLRTYHKSYKTERQTKRRRFELKKKRLFTTAINEIKEGVTYESNCVHDNEELDISGIPDCQDTMEDIPDYSGNEPFVFFDVETTSLGSDAEIVQLSACNGNEQFNQFVLPEGPIHSKASAVNGLKIITNGNTQTMEKNGQPVVTVPINVALDNFFKWLTKFDTGKSTLVAHNGKVFDMRILLKACLKHGYKEKLTEVVGGFVDTLPLFRLITEKGHSLSLSNIYQREFGVSFNAHDSMEDAVALERLFNANSPHANAKLSYISINNALKYMNSVNSVNKHHKEIEAKLCIENKVISNYLAKKIARSGLSYANLKLAHSRDSVNGLRLIFSETTNQKARVTRNKKIIDALNKYFTAETIETI